MIPGVNLPIIVQKYTVLCQNSLEVQVPFMKILDSLGTIGANYASSGTVGANI